MNIQTDRGSEFVDPNVKKISLKYNTILSHSYSPIKTVLAKRLIRRIRLLIYRYCKLKNTAVFIQDLNKIMLIYNQHPGRSLFNHSPLEAHHSNNTLDVFLK